MDADKLVKIIRDHKPLTIRYFDQKSYKIGENAGILQLEPQPEPDNRIPVPIIRRATKLTKGYFAKVGNISYADKDGWFESQLADIYDKNDEELETSAVFEDAITYGRAFELHWFDETDGFQFAVIPIAQCIPIYSDDLKPKLIGFVWYRKVDGGELATWYDKDEYQEYKKTGEGNWTLDIERSGKHLYGRVPICEANIDRDKRNMFDHALPLMDLYDKLVSMVGNEHEKFAQAILLLRDKLDATTEDENGLTDADKVRMWRVLDSLQENVRDSAAYLERNVNDAFIDHTLDRIERLIYEMLCLFNPNDDSFATASGIAQAYKLLGFEYLISDMESYFSQFLIARMHMIADHKAGKIKQPERASFVTISFARYLPKNLEEAATIATTLMGGKQVISHKTALKLFPTTMIPDIDAEIAAVKLEEKMVENPDSGIEGIEVISGQDK